MAGVPTHDPGSLRRPGRAGATLPFGACRGISRARIDAGQPRRHHAGVVMGEDQAMKEHLLDQIADVHEHFVELMNRRLPEAGQRELELYLGVLGKLVAKLEAKDKTLKEAAQEMMGEVAGLVMAGMTR
jgi:hypothetical protein